MNPETAIRPVVSIVIPVFNRPQFIPETLESVRQQTLGDWEMIVVDDGSDEATRKILSDYKMLEPRVRVHFRNREPKGAATCRNIGLDAARGDYVIFLDSDDLLGVDCLTQRVRVMSENSGMDFAVFQGLIFKTKPGDTALAWNVSNNENDLCCFLRGDALWQTAGVLWKKSSVQRLVGFDEQLSAWQDTDLHVRALISKFNYVVRFDLEPDYFYRRHGLISISQKGFYSRETIKSTLKFCAKSAEALGESANEDQKTALRSMFARQVQQAVGNPYFDLADEGIQTAAQFHLLGFREKFLWHAACVSHKIRARGFPGFARLGNYLMDPYQPKTSIGLVKIPEKSGGGATIKIPA